jgi:hypothetical protein
MDALPLNESAYFRILRSVVAKDVNFGQHPAGETENIHRFTVLQRGT